MSPQSAPSRAVRLAVFDCDGTLSDGQAAVCAAMDAAFAAAGLPAPNHREVRRIVGLSLPQAILRLAPAAPDEQRIAALEAYKTAFRAARRDGSLHEPLFDGIAELLGGLHGAGWVLAVATGKSDRGLKSTLSAHGMLDFFSTLQTADRHPSKPHPSMIEAAMEAVFASPGQTVVIGDTVYDMEMARAAGVRALGVAWGYHEPQELIEAGAERVAQNAAELREMLDA